MVGESGVSVLSLQRSEMELRTVVLCAVLAVVTSAQEVPQDDTLVKKVVSSASNALGFDLYEVVSAAEKGNVALSPVSAGAALALVLQGAGGRTAQQIAAALHLADAGEAARGYKALFAGWKSSEQVLLRVANAVFSERGFPVRQAFRDLADAAFRAQSQQLDFAKEAEGARATINEWVNNATAGNIPELFAQGDLDQTTVMVIVNAIYFRGNWATPFRENGTRELPFYSSPTTQIMVPTMSDAVELGYTIEPQMNASVLQLYYNDNATRMLIFVPHTLDGLPLIEKNLKTLDLRTLTFDRSVVQLQLPKFNVSSDLKLKETLQQLGIKDLFDKDAANLTALTDLRGIFASKVVQKAIVEVSEKGTEAAAATGIELVDRFGAMFQVDRPFVFMIVDENHTILFLGRVINPIAT